jgi:hypothetical protein
MLRHCCLQEAPMSMLAYFQEPSGTPERRRSERRSLRLDLAGASASGAQVTIHDLSLTGALLETSIGLGIGETFLVDVPEAGSVEAVVVWNGGEFYGCQFKSPISPAALSAALLISPPRAPAAVPAPPMDPVAELRDLNEQVERLAHKVEEAIEKLSRKKNGDS